MPRRVIEFRHTSVIKHDWSALRCRNEALRSRAAAEVAPTVPARVPRVLQANASWIEFERIDDLQPLDEWLSRSPGQVCLTTRRIGVTLAGLHQQLQLPPGHLPAGLPASSSSPVALHGDFTVANVAVRRSELVVLDWAPPDWADADGMLMGPPEWDIALFLTSLYLRRPGDPKPIRHLSSAGPAFVQGYLSRRPVDLSALPAFYRWQLRHLLPNERGWPRRISRLPQLAHGYVRTVQASRHG